MSFRLIVFDLDGTLVDSRQDITESANATLVACGAPPLPEEAIARMVGDGAPTLIARAFAAAGTDLPAGALDRFLAIYDGRLLRHTRPYAGIPELLDQLAGRALLAVLTNKPLAAAQRILAGLDLSKYFPADRVVGGDGPFRRKPDPAGLAYLMTSAGVSADATAMVGDSVVDWRTAVAAATGVVLARYGFGFESFPLESLNAGARVVDAPLEMLTYL
ncbi:MAG: HAD-IA family hydrolase [Acidobacteriota bacterium]